MGMFSWAIQIGPVKSQGYLKVDEVTEGKCLRKIHGSEPYVVSYEGGEREAQTVACG